jgi:aarF domain-containing kinase
MSGCARCVYDLHFEDLQDYQQDLTAARSRLLSLSPPLDEKEWDVSLLGARSKHTGGQDNRSAGDKAQDEVDAVIGNLDPSMKAFLQLEQSLKRSGKHSTSNSSA